MTWDCCIVSGVLFFLSFLTTDLSPFNNNVYFHPSLLKKYIHVSLLVVHIFVFRNDVIELKVGRKDTNDSLKSESA